MITQTAVPIPLRWFAFAILLLLPLLLVGCAREEAAPSVLRLNLGEEPSTADPALATDSISIDVVGSLFIGLTDVDEETRQVIPALAREWSVSKDGLTWTFELRKDAKWTNGQPVTAHDVVFGTLRTLDPKTASDYAYVAAAIIKGASDFNGGKTTDPGIVGVKAVDDDTVTFTLEHPAGYFPSIAGMWVLYPQPKAAIEAHGDKWIEPGNIVTNGPFKLESWEHEKKMVMVKNPDYYDVKNVKINRIEFSMVAEASTEMALYEAGDLDCTCGWGVPLTDIDRVKKDPKLTKELYIAPQNTTYYYGFNVEKPPMDKALVRKAFAAAVDRQSLIDNVLKGGQLPAQTFTNPGNFGAVDGVKEGIGVPFNPTKAREYLAQAGYPGGKGLPEITLMYNTSEGHKKIAEAIQAMWKEHLGVEVKVVNQEFRVYLKTLQEDAPQIWRLGWGADYPDANNWLNEVFHSKADNNNANYSNPKFDKLVEDAAREQDPEKRKKLYRDAEILLSQEDVPLIPIYFYTTVQLTKPALKRTYATFGPERFKNWRIEK